MNRNSLATLVLIALAGLILGVQIHFVPFAHKIFVFGDGISTASYLILFFGAYLCQKNIGVIARLSIIAAGITGLAQTTLHVEAWEYELLALAWFMLWQAVTVTDEKDFSVNYGKLGLAAAFLAGFVIDLIDDSNKAFLWTGKAPGSIAVVCLLSITMSKLAALEAKQRVLARLIFVLAWTAFALADAWFIPWNRIERPAFEGFTAYIILCAPLYEHLCLRIAEQWRRRNEGGLAECKRDTAILLRTNDGK